MCGEKFKQLGRNLVNAETDRCGPLFIGFKNENKEIKIQEVVKNYLR